MYGFGYRWYLWPFYLIKDIYWCFIPLKCRDCAFLEQCRKGFWKGRTCYSGCIKLNFARKRELKQKYEDDRLDYVDKLMEYCDDLEKKGMLR